MSKHAERLAATPIPPIEGHTAYFHAGQVDGGREFDDRSVPLNVIAEHDDRDRSEHPRFDCLDEDPHYHDDAATPAGTLG